MEPVLTFEDVSFRHRGGERLALDRVNLRLAPGETTLVLGRSGSGKSTLCFCCNGLIPHFLKGEMSGRVTAAGRDTRGNPVRSFAPDVGMVFQDFESQLFATTAELEAAFGPENLALPREEIRRRVTAALERTGLPGFEKRFPATLSGGQKQRLAIAAALSLEPRLLVFDEPTSDLDPLGKEQVHAIARSLGREREMSLLIVEPETEEADRADRVVVMQGGRVALDGASGEILARVEDLRGLGVRPLPAAETCSRLGLPRAMGVDEAATAILAAGHVPRPRPAPASPARDGKPALSARSLSFAYPGAPPVLRGLDLDIGRGELVALLGQNGSGKTTLAKLLAGLLEPSGGAAAAGGRDLARMPRGETSRAVGFVFQNPDHQIFAETVEAEVSFGPRLQGLAPGEIEERVGEALTAVGLAGRRRSDPFLLSKGERQRVAVASVLATRPETIILDEPTTGLDYGEIRDMMDLVGRLNAAGHTIVMITHAMWVAAEYARRVLVMDRGAIVADGHPRRVFHQTELLRGIALKAPQAAVLAGELGLDEVSVDGILASLRGSG